MASAPSQWAQHNPPPSTPLHRMPQRTRFAKSCNGSRHAGRPSMILKSQRRCPFARLMGWNVDFPKSHENPSLTLCLVLSLAAVSCLVIRRAAPRSRQPSPVPHNRSPMTTIKVQAHEVLLPVTVIDKHGALVTNLTAKDFTLTEDGRPQIIKSFTTQSNLPFRLGLLVDTSRSVYSAMDSERKAAEKFVDLMLPADPKAGVHGDKAFLIHFDREVELLEDFTDSRDKLHHELDAMRPTSRERNNQGPETSGDDRGTAAMAQACAAAERSSTTRSILPPTS